MATAAVLAALASLHSPQTNEGAFQLQCVGGRSQV